MYFRDKEKNVVTLPHSAQGRYYFFGEMKSKSEKLAPRKKVDLELLRHILGHISTISLIDGDTVHFGRILNLG